MSDMWRKTLVYLGLVEEPEEHDELEAARRVVEDTRPPQGAGEPEATVRPLRAVDDGYVRPLAGEPGSVRILRPRAFEDVEEIGERFRTGEPVLVDLERVDNSVARRLLDFAGGTIFALRGRIVPLGKRAFLLMPEGVSVSSEERRRLADLGYQVGADAAAGNG
jgi:cell division inhibitor SepF